VGEVTLRDAESFLVQDASGSIRVQYLGNRNASPNIGDTVEVDGFPVARETTPLLTEAVVRAAEEILRVPPAKLDLSAGMPVSQNGNLVSVEATLLGQRTTGGSQILELQARQRIFTATLLTNQGALVAIVPGSRLQITGVCNSENTALPGGTNVQERASLASLNLQLRSPADLKILSGAPWWTWRRASALIGTLLAILSGALLWVYLLRRRLKRQKAAQLAASEQILKRLEEERRRIAANLHDSLGQVLLAIKNQTLLAMQRAPDETAVRERLGEISGATSQALEEVRQITHGLRPYQLDRLGLSQAMRATVTGASNNSQIMFASRVEDLDTLFDKDSEIHVYRIVQEAINNVLKHSAATEAAVVIKNRTNSVSLSIRDNGRGFSVAAMRSSQTNHLGYGLSGMAERARILGGNLTIDSQPGGGTSLTVEIPINHHAAGNNNTDRG
jgi:signal transduction histidine kinase